MTRVAALAGATAAVCAAVAAVAATAQAATFAGKIEGYSSSSVYLTFAEIRGERYLDQVELHNYPVFCDSDDYIVGSAIWQFDPPTGQVEHRGFRGVQGETVRRTVRGGFRGGGRLTGFLRERHTGNGDACDTGRLGWKARKGI
jgi:hypothetical protein